MLQPCREYVPLSPGSGTGLPDCPSDNPFANFSSEGPDGLDYISRRWSYGSATSCGVTYTSIISQSDADLQAASLASLCAFQNSTPDAVAVTNTPQTGGVPCGGGGESFFTIGAGYFYDLNQAGANQQAQDFAQQQASANPVCLRPTAPSGCVGKAYSATVVANSSLPITWTVTGALPAGITWSSIGSTVTFAGIPTMPGANPVTVTATIGARKATYALTFYMVGITNLPVPNGALGVYYDYLLLPGGFSDTADPTFEIDPSTPLPAGLELTGAGSIIGTPTTNFSGSVNVLLYDALLAPDGPVCTTAVPLTIGGFGNLTVLDVLAPQLQYWNSGLSIPAGTYKISYINGADQIHNSVGAPWAINNYLTPGLGCSIVYNNGTASVLFYNAVTAPNTNTGYANQAAVESANAGAYISIVHTRGTIGLQWTDVYYLDNTNGGPNPTFSLQ